MARIARTPTLAAAIARVDWEMVEMEALERSDPSAAKYRQSVGPNDVLLVPTLLWQISHHFSDLEGKTFLNPRLKGQRLDVGQQVIFCLSLDEGRLSLLIRNFNHPA